MFVQDKTTALSRAHHALHSTLRSALCGATAALALASCSGAGSTGANTPEPGLHFVSGATGTDTVEAVLSKPLIAEFRDDSGQTLASRTVVFLVYTLPTADSTSFTDGVTLTIGAMNSNSQGSISAMTDANGRVSAEVRLGKSVGEAIVIAGIPGTQLRDTARYAVRPGAPARVTLLPRDTALYPAARLVLRQTVRDRLGNATAGSIPVTYSSNDGITVSSGGIATPRDPGRAFIVAHTGSYSDSIALTVLPVTGTLVASLPATSDGAAGVAMMNLDGSGYQEFAKNLGPMIAFSEMQPRWTYDGKSLIVRIGLQSDVRLWTVPLSGAAPRRLLVSPTFASEDWPSPSPDGQWVYYCAGSGAVDHYFIHRVHLDGTGIQMLPLATPNLGDEKCGSPGVSATGEWVVWAVPGDGRMKTRSVATGVRTALNREGTTPAWAPTGTRLAYIKGNPGPLYTTEYDGSDDRLVAQGYYSGPLSWSPDGKFILALRSPTSKYDLIDVATGATYPLPFAIGPNAVLKPAIK